MHRDTVSQLAATGVLRAGINMSNFLLVTKTSPEGIPEGVSPDIAHELASTLGVVAELKPYAGPGEVADGIANDEWDIGNIAAEAERAKTIQFSIPYCEIQATYLLQPGSAIQSLVDVDTPEHRVVVKQRSAYDLWLSENLQHAQIIRTDNVDAAFDKFVNDERAVLAGLRPKLIEQQAQLAGSVLMDESFTAVQQSIGCAPRKPEALKFINAKIREWICSGFIQGLIDKHGVTGKLSVAAIQG